MATPPTSPLPKSRIPTWERRRRPERWRWNGRRYTDPRLPSLGLGESSPRRILTCVFTGSLLSLLLLFLVLQ